MLLVRRLRQARTLAVRSYGFEDPEEKTGALFYQYADSLNTRDDKHPSQLGYTISPHDQVLDRRWARPGRSYAVTDMNEGGVNKLDIVDSELNDHPFGDYDLPDVGKSVSEVKTRIIHVLRHFEKVNLKNLDWGAHLEDGIGLDSLERVALLTSVEFEFHTIFEDNVFDHVKNLNDVVKLVSSDRFVI